MQFELPLRNVSNNADVFIVPKAVAIHVEREIIMIDGLTFHERGPLHSIICCLVIDLIQLVGFLRHEIELRSRCRRIDCVKNRI